VYSDNLSCSHRERYRAEVVGIIGDFIVQYSVEDVGSPIDNQCSVTVGRRLCHSARADIAADDILDIEFLAEMLGQLVCD
jgi:hypothetical protein